MKPLPNEVIFISGQRGSGKSYWTKQFIRSLPRAVIYDPLGEYRADHYFTESDELVEFLENDGGRFYTISFNPVDDDVEYLCRAALARGDLHVVFEEIDTLSTPYSTPYHLSRLIKYGRHYGIQLAGVSRRPAEVSRLFTSQASRFVIFPQVEPNDIKYWRSVIGAAADGLPSMPAYHYLDVDFNENPLNTAVNPPIG